MSVPMEQMAEEPDEPDEWISDDGPDPNTAPSRTSKRHQRTASSKASAPSASPVAGKKKRQLNRHGKLLVQVFVVAGSLVSIFGFRPAGILSAALLGGISAVVCAAIASGIAMLFNMVEE
jgi:hypothetical protein